jgi:hypothetical protein
MKKSHPLHLSFADYSESIISIATMMQYDCTVCSAHTMAFAEISENLLNPKDNKVIKRSVDTSYVS